MCWGIRAGGELEQREGRGLGSGKECGEVAPGVIWLSQPASSNRGLWRELLRAKWEQLGEGKRAAGESRQQWREIQIKFFRVSSAGLVMSEAVEGRMSQGGWCRARLGERWIKVLRYKTLQFGRSSQDASRGETGNTPSIRQQRKVSWGAVRSVSSCRDTVPVFERGLCVTPLASPAQALWLFTKKEVPRQHAHPALQAWGSVAEGAGLLRLCHQHRERDKANPSCSRNSWHLLWWWAMEWDHSVANSPCWCIGWVVKWLLPAPVPHSWVLFPLCTSIAMLCRMARWSQEMCPRDSSCSHAGHISCGGDVAGVALTCLSQ